MERRRDKYILSIDKEYIMKIEIIKYNMFNGEKKTEITKEESGNVESITIRQTMDKEEAQEYLKRNKMVYGYFAEMETAQSRAIKTALDKVNGLIKATWDVNK